MMEIQKAEEKVRADDNRWLLTAINKVDADRQADFAFMRRELETVALLTQNSLQARTAANRHPGELLPSG